MEDRNLSYEDLSEDQKVIHNKQTIEGYYKYTLKGVVVHAGNSDSGHYYSFIQERENGDRWFEFNDKDVKPFNPENIKRECYGGEDPEFDRNVASHSNDP